MFHKFPVDKQCCQVKFESFGYTSKQVSGCTGKKYSCSFRKFQIQYSWLRVGSHVNKNISLAQFSFHVKLFSSYNTDYYDMEYPGLIMEVVFTPRDCQIFNIIFPAASEPPDWLSYFADLYPFHCICGEYLVCFCYHIHFYHPPSPGTRLAVSLHLPRLCAWQGGDGDDDSPHCHHHVRLCKNTLWKKT